MNFDPTMPPMALTTTARAECPEDDCDWSCERSGASYLPSVKADFERHWADSHSPVPPRPGLPRNPIHQEHQTDLEGRPAGGYTGAQGLQIYWQSGPALAPTDRNGAYVEDVIEAAIGRIEHYQTSPFHCLANAVALGHLRAASEVLAERTRERTDRGVEGTHTP